MSDAAERPFEPTPRRIAKARREGNLARSGELAANCAFAAAAAAVAAGAGLFGSVAANALAAGIAAPPAAHLAVLAVAMLPCACAAIAGTFAGLVQNGGVAFVPVAFKAERLNPIQGIRRVLSRETVAHSTRAAMAFICAALAMAPAVISSGSDLMRADSPRAGAWDAWQGAQRVAASAAAVGLFFAAAEYAAARTAWLRRLRMSFEERKREVKEEEGDAAARGRRRALHRAVLRGGVSRVKEAAFVVVNPQHLAVALAYAPPRIAVPEVLICAAGETALRVRELATHYRLPVVENVTLARALYHDARAGEPIPHALYVAVAEVVTALVRAGDLAR